jgi:hypothetical protein
LTEAGRQANTKSVNLKDACLSHQPFISGLAVQLFLPHEKPGNLSPWWDLYTFVDTNCSLDYARLAEWLRTNNPRNGLVEKLRNEIEIYLWTAHLRLLRGAHYTPFGESQRLRALLLFCRRDARSSEASPAQHCG